MSQNTELKAQAKKPGLNKKGIAAWINNYSFILIALAIFIAYLFINHGATTWSGVMNILRHSAVVGIMAFGMGLVIITGGIDLSLGTVMMCAALLGVPLVLKRYSMIGDGLSHVSFGALSVAVACGFAPLWFSIPVVVIAAFILMHVAEKSRVSADAMIAVFSASALAIGVIVTSLTTGMTTDVDSYMFGSILAMSRSDVILSVTLALCVLALYILFYHKLFSVTFDESFARATGVRVGTYKTILSVLTALTVVLGMRMMGAMLLSSLIIFPALSAMRLFKSFRSVVCFAAALSVVCFCLGLTGSYLLSTPVGATVVVCDLTAFLLCCLIGRGRG